MWRDSCEAAWKHDTQPISIFYEQIISVSCLLSWQSGILAIFFFFILHFVISPFAPAGVEYESIQPFHLRLVRKGIDYYSNQSGIKVETHVMVNYRTIFEAGVKWVFIQFFLVKYSPRRCLLGEVFIALSLEMNGERCWRRNTKAGNSKSY